MSFLFWLNMACRKLFTETGGNTVDICLNLIFLEFMIDFLLKIQIKCSNVISKFQLKKIKRMGMRRQDFVTVLLVN